MAAFADQTGALAPADIFQILLSSEPSGSPPPRQVERNFRLVRYAHPSARHHILNEADVRSLIGAHFEAEVLSAFDQLTPLAFRADLARYAFLLVHGGLYVDVGVRFVSPLRGPANSALVAFRDYWMSALRGNAVMQSVVLARPGRPEFKTAIDMIVAHVRNRFYGANPIDVSGPGVFARALAHHNDGASYWLGQFLPVAPETKLKNFVYLTPDGEIVALGKTGPGGDLSYLGFSSGNNYVDIWRARQVYGEGLRRWGHDAAQLSTEIARRLADGLHYAPPARGFVIYGPYCPLPAGAYRAVWRFAPGASVGRCAFDVAYDSGRREAARIPPGRAETADDCVILEFQLARPQNDVECRMWSEGADSGRLLEIVIQPA